MPVAPVDHLSSPASLRAHTGALPCPACATTVDLRHAECARCAEPLFKIYCGGCRAVMLAGHDACPTCGTATTLPAPPRLDWAEGTPVPERTARFDRFDFAEPSRDDAPTHVRCVGSAPIRRLAVRPSRGPCPRCASPLVQRALGGLDLDECFPCGALFVEPLELARLVFDPAVAIALVPGLLARTAVHPTRGGRLRGCPVCRRRLSLRMLATPAARAAVCRDHGAWFEPAALAAAARELADGILAGGEHERAVFRDDVRHGRYQALVAHARALRGRAPDRASPLSLLAELVA